MRCQNIGLRGSLAQSVEHRTFNPLVARSSRARPTRISHADHELTPPRSGGVVLCGAWRPCIAMDVSAGRQHATGSLCGWMPDVCIRTSAHVWPGARAPFPGKPRGIPLRSILFPVIYYRNNLSKQHGKFLFRIPLIRDRFLSSPGRPRMKRPWRARPRGAVCGAFFSGRVS